jgi:hypothetical protein
MKRTTSFLVFVATILAGNNPVSVALRSATLLMVYSRHEGFSGQALGVPFRLKVSR